MATDKTSPAPRPKRAARGIVVVDLGARKEAVEAFAKAQDLTVSQLVREAVLPMVGDSEGGAAPAPAPKKGVGGRMPARRWELRLQPDIDEALQKRVAQSGFANVQDYVQALIKAHLGRGAQFNFDELKALGESNRRLIEIGQRLRKMPPGPEIAAALNEMRAHLQVARTLMVNNEERWAG